MRVLVQKSLNSSVEVCGNTVGSIDYGLVLLVGFKNGDTSSDVDYLRIFDDENHVMNKSILDVKGSVLSISQFTLYADTKKGNRPSYINAMNGSNAHKLYDEFNDKLSKIVRVEKGIFGEDMKVNIKNDGPTTILLESKG